MWQPAQIINKQQWTKDLFTLTVETPLQDYVAGQFTKLAIFGQEKIISRAYSFANAPDHNQHSFYIKEIEGGKLTPALAKLNIGDTVSVSQRVAGHFTVCDLPSKPVLWCFSTGTALGVFLSILLDSTPWEKFEEIHLVYNCRHHSELTYTAVIAQIQAQYGNRFSFHGYVSADPTHQGLTGRFSTQLASLSALSPISAENAHVMLCGNPNMIKSMTEQLSERGMSRFSKRHGGCVSTEQYWQK
jgi:ferredoxin--NADP+ reductase